MNSSAMPASSVNESDHPVWTAEHAKIWIKELVQKGDLSPCRVLVPSAAMGEEAVTLARLGFRVQVIDPDRSALDAAGQLAGKRETRIDLIHGDFFSVRPGKYGSVDLIFDRALIHELEPIRRADWAHQIARILPKEGRLLGFFRIGNPTPAPPYPVTRTALLKLLGRHFRVKSMEETGSVPAGADQAWRGIFLRK